MQKSAGALAFGQLALMIATSGSIGLVGCGQDFLVGDYEPPDEEGTGTSPAPPDPRSFRESDGRDVQEAGSDGRGWLDARRGDASDALADTTSPDTRADTHRPDGDAAQDCKDTERCNGRDDDCDGIVDEGCPCAYRQNPRGVCGNATIEASTGECGRPAGYRAEESRCDGVDNDCDGVVDEAPECSSQKACVASTCSITAPPSPGETHVAFHFDCPTGELVKAFPYERADRLGGQCWRVECLFRDETVTDRFCAP